MLVLILRRFVLVLRGKVTMLFVTHAIGRNLQIGQVVRLDARVAAAAPQATAGGVRKAVWGAA